MLFLLLLNIIIQNLCVAAQGRGMIMSGTLVRVLGAPHPLHTFDCGLKNSGSAKPLAETSQNLGKSITLKAGSRSAASAVEGGWTLSACEMQRMPRRVPCPDAHPPEPNPPGAGRVEASTAAAEELVQWIEEGGGFCHPHLAVSSATPSGQRGLVACAPIPAKDVERWPLLVVPESLYLTADAAREVLRRRRPRALPALWRRSVPSPEVRLPSDHL
jgi:hypothetical protein